MCTAHSVQLFPVSIDGYGARGEEGSVFLRRLAIYIKEEGRESCSTNSSLATGCAMASQRSVSRATQVVRSLQDAARSHGVSPNHCESVCFFIRLL